jgi:hypothetical protein
MVWAGAVTPSLVAEIVTVPGEMAVMVAVAPAPFTVAIAALLEVHVIARLLSTVPLPLLSTAVACVVPLGSNPGFASVTCALTTGGTETVIVRVRTFVVRPAPEPVALIVTVATPAPTAVIVGFAPFAVTVAIAALLVAFA